jgi:SAM-dependent methyltransferase
LEDNIIQFQKNKMAHINHGIRKILNLTFVYRLYQLLVKKNWSDKYYVDHYVKPFQNCSILDIGCGNGHFLKYYPNSTTYYGFDMNPNYIKDAEDTFKNKGIFICGSASDFNFPKDLKFDIVTANAIFHHLTDEELEKIFKNAANVLKEGGCLVSLDPVYIPNQNFISKYMISKDRGQNIRNKEDFEVISSKYFSRMESSYEDNFYIFPFDLIINKFYL